MRQADVELDLSGLSCPLPLLKAKMALNEMAVGKVLKVVATDPGSERDFHAFAQRSQHELLAFHKVFHKGSDKFYYWLKKA